MEPSSAAADLIAGFVSGTVSTLVVHPVDTVLTRFQAVEGKGGVIAGWSSPVASRSTETTSSAFRGSSRSYVAAKNLPGSAALAESRAMASSLGMLSLWRGAPALIGAAPFQNALLMAGYGAGRRWSGGDKFEEGDFQQKNDRMRDVFVGGVVGGILQSFVASPAELYKVRRQVSDMFGLKKITAAGSSGRPWFTAGLGATMLRDGIPHGVWFASYEWCKAALGPSGRFDIGDDGQAMATPLLSGAFAAFVAWAVGYPADIVKTRIQAGRANGVFNAVNDIVTCKDGKLQPPGTMAMSLYRGFGLKLARAIPASAIGFVVYENTLAFIEG